MRRTALTSALALALSLALAAPTLAQGVIRFQGTDFLPDAPNPCTGQLEDIHFTAMVTIRESDGMVMFHAVGTATQGAFSGPVVTRSTDVWSANTFVSTFNSNVIMRDGSGRATKGNFLFHTTWSESGAAVDLARVSLTCIGGSG